VPDFCRILADDHVIPVRIIGYLIEPQTLAVPITFLTSRYIQKFAEANLRGD
jgi:hypothetical protein